MTIIFCIHYFLWFGALKAIFGYESVYSQYYTNSTAMQYGYLNMVLPFVTVLAVPVVCSLADRRQAHRSYFAVSLIFTNISMVLLGFLTIITDPHDEHKPLRLGPWIYFCTTSFINNIAIGINTCLSDSFAVIQAEESGSSFGRVVVWGTFGWASTAIILSYINQINSLPRLLPGILLGSLLLAIDIIIVSFWRKHSDFTLDVVPNRPAFTLSGSPPDIRKDNETRPVQAKVINSNQDQKRFQANRSSNQATSDTGMVEYPSSSIKTIDSNSRESQMDEERSKLSIEQASNAASDAEKKSRRSKIAKSVNRSVTAFRTQMIMFMLILTRRKSLIRYLLLFTLAGFFMSMHWNYFFLYLHKIHKQKFYFISALSMIGQSLLGELPFFIISNKFIQFFGQSHTLSVSFITIGIRFLLYGLLLPLVSMYFVFLADCLQGPNYSLFYVVMTEIGLEFSYCDDETFERLTARGEVDQTDPAQADKLRLSLRSTVQSVGFACYEGLGVGIGSLVGGWIVTHYGFRTLWLVMAVGSISVGLINIAVECLCRESDLAEKVSERREFLDAYRAGAVKKLASPQPLPQSDKRQSKPQQDARNKVQMFVSKGANLMAPPN